MSGAYSTYGGEKKYIVLVRKLEVKGTLGRPMCRWKDIKMDLILIRWEGIN